MSCEKTLYRIAGPVLLDVGNHDAAQPGDDGPFYIAVRRLDLYNTYAGMIIPMIASPFGVFLMRQFMQSIPDELLDAAKMDGASEFGLFWRIVVPFTGPAVATLSIFTFFNAWNNFMWQLIMAKDYTMMTLPWESPTFHRLPWATSF